MKQPIKPEDIRKGDLIRVEYEHDEYTVEKRVGVDGVPLGLACGTRYYLLDRPKPKPDLPTKPTLGWAEWTSDWGRYLAVWRVRGKDLVPSADRVITSGRINDEFISFTPAVAVPKAALDELRDWFAFLFRGKSSDQYVTPATRRIRDFLAAVDAANGGDR